MGTEIIEHADKILTESLEAPALDPVVLSIANEHLAGKTMIEIANEFDISPDIVTQVLDKKDVKNYVDNTYLTQGYMNRYKRVKILNDMINQKIEDAMETQVWTKKDLLEVLKELNVMEKDARPKEKGPAIALQVNNNYTDIMEKLING